MALGLVACSPSSLPSISGIANSLPSFSDLSNSLPSLGTENTTSAAIDALAQRGQATVSNEALVEDGTLTVGIRTDWVTAPLCFEQDGSYVGLDVDLAAAMADAMGLKLKVVSIARPIDSLGKTCDVVMDMSDQEAGDTGGIQVVGFYEQAASGFYHKGATGTALVSDLSSKRVGVQGGSVSASALSATGLVMDSTAYGNLNDAFAALDKGEVDYVLCDAYSGAYLAMRHDDVAFCGTLGAATPRGIGVLTTNTALQQAVGDALATVQGNGQGDIIRSLWVGGMPDITDVDEVQGVPEAEQATAATATSAQTVSAGDGSTAGGNAVIL